MKTFCHAGESGDLIYALPAIKALGGGDLILHRTTRLDIARPRGFTEQLFENIAPLLRKQSYIKSVEYQTNVPFVDYDLNLFRKNFDGCFNTEYAKRGIRIPNLMQMVLVAFNLPEPDNEIPWLELPTSTKTDYVIVNRSLRYNNPKFPWRMFRDKYNKRIRFLGTDKEHRAFVDSFGVVERIECPNLLDAALIINSAEMFIGNQSCLCAIAEGLKKPLIQETCTIDKNCMFQRNLTEYI